MGGALTPEPLLALVRPKPGGELPEGPVELNQNHGQAKRGGSVAEAIRISKMGSFQRRVAAFRGKFFAATSARARASKRAEIIKLAKAVRGSNEILPLNKTLVEGVAAALKESGMKSGPQYLVELKLMHVEAGYEVEAWLKRTLDLCKKALERARGPVNPGRRSKGGPLEVGGARGERLGQGDSSSPQARLCMGNRLDAERD